MKKFFALLLTMAMVLSLFSGVVLAAAPVGTSTIRYGNSTYRAPVNTETTLSLVYSNTTLTDKVTVTYDFPQTGSFTVTGVGTLPSGWTATIDTAANSVSYTGKVGGRNVTFKPTVKTPTVIDTAIDLPTVEQSVGGVVAPVVLSHPHDGQALSTAFDFALNMTSVKVGQSAVIQGILTEGGKKPSFTGYANLYVSLYATNGTTALQTVSVAQANDGIFVFSGVTYAEGTYRIVPHLTATPPASATSSTSNTGRALGYTSVSSKYEFTLDNPGTVTLDEVKVLTGKVQMYVNGELKPAPGVDLNLYYYHDVDATYYTTSGTPIGATGADGTFAVLKKFTDVAKYQIGTPNFNYAAVADLAPKAATLSVESELKYVPNVAGTLNLDMTLGTDDDGNDVTSATGTSRFTFTGVRIVDENAVWAGDNFTVDWDRSTWVTAIDANSAYFTKLVLKYTGTPAGAQLDVKFLDKGTLTLKAEFIPADSVTSSTPDYAVTKTVTVLGASEFNANFTVKKGANVIDEDDLIANDAYTIEIDAFDKDGLGADAAGVNRLNKVVVTYSAPGVDEEEVEVTADAIIPIAITATSAGEIKLSVQGTFDNGSKTAVISKILKVDGYTITLASDEGTVGSDVVTLTATIVDGEGKPVNNAKVEFKADKAEAFIVMNSNDVYVTKTDTVVINGASNNVSNGVYSKTVKLNNAATVTVKVFKTEFNTTTNTVTQTKVMASEEYTINGQPVYTLTATQPTILAGIPEALTIKVTDAAGTAVTSGVSFKVKALTDVTEDEAISDLATLGYTIVDGAFKFPNVVANRKGEYQITASTTNGNKQGQVVLTAVNPVLEMNITDSLVTENVKDVFEVKVLDPRTNTELEAKLLVGVVSGYNSDDVNDGPTSRLKVYTADRTGKYVDLVAGGVLGDSEIASTYDFAVLATNAELVNSSTDEEYTPKIRIRLVGEDKAGNTIYNTLNTLVVTPAQIKVSPESIFANALNDVILTYVDAHGNAMADRKVNVPGVLTDVLTDADGKVSFSIMPNATSAIKMTAKTDGSIKVDATIDSTTVVEKTLTFSADTVKPVLTVKAPAIVKTNTVTITGTATDNVKVANVYVNNAPVFVFDGTFETDVALRLGENRIRFYVVDAAGNGAQEIVVVDYVMPTLVKLALGSSDATIDGRPANGVAPYVKGASTMVPFRFIGEALGATVNYANVGGIQTVTLTLDGTTVVLTIGSTTAMVNGEAKTMPVAPEVTSGRTMVPLRFVGEALGATVDFNYATNAILVTR